MKELQWKSRRLTNDMRKGIIAKIKKEVFSKRLETLKKEEIDIGLEIYDHIISDSNLVIMNRLPSEYFYSNTYSHIKVDGNNYHTERIEFGKAMKLPYLSANGRKLCELPKDHKLVKKLANLQDKFMKLQEDKTELNREIRGILFSVTTEKKLVEIWPDALKYMIAPVAINPDHCLVPTCDNVNKLMRGLARKNK